ncbi:hypothetical protein Chor_017090 [Crotalus horridus]
MAIILFSSPPGRRRPSAYVPPRSPGERREGHRKAQTCFLFPCRTSEFSCQIGGCSQVFNTLESYEHHYNMLHRNVCSSCKRSFPSTHLLDVHILEWHDSLFQIMAEKQNMYQCLVESCPEKFKSSKDRKDHLITVHRYPSDFRFDKSLKAQRKEKMRPLSKESNVPMDMTVEDSEQLHVEAMETGPDESVMESDVQSETECTVDSPAFGKWLYRSRLVALHFSDGLESLFEFRPLFVLGKGLPGSSKAEKRKVEYDNQEEFHQQKSAFKKKS